MASLADETSVEIIEPRLRGARERARELVRHRRLIRFFGVRMLRRLYARTVLGRAWIVIRPLFETASRALIFGGLLGAQSNGAPYFLFFLSGMAIWTLFDRSLYWSTRSLEANRGLVTKLYFPRLILPVASLVPAIVEFGMYVILCVLAFTAWGIADGVMYAQIEPVPMLAVLAALLMAVAFAFAISLWTSVLGAQTRDMRFTLTYVLNFWFFLTPVIYPLSQIPDRFQTLALINPLTPVVELFKWGLLGAGEVSYGGFAWVLALTAAIGAGGLWFFSNAESASVDRM